MNKLYHPTFRALAISAVALSLCACSDDLYLGEGSYEVAPASDVFCLNIDKTSSDFYVPASSSSYQFQLYAYNVNWRFSDTPDWISISPNYGSESALITLDVAEHTSADDARTGIFYLQSESSGFPFSKAFAVTQYAAVASVSCSYQGKVLSEDEPLNLPYKAGSVHVDVTANFDWADCVYVSDGNGWLEVSKEGDKLKITTLSDNATVSSRQAYIQINNANSGYSFRVSQYPATVTTDDDVKLSVPASGGKYSANLSADLDWEINESSIPSWVSVSPLSGSVGSTILSIEVAPNNSTSSRSTSFAVSAESVTRLSFSISQEAIYLKLGSINSFAAAGESQQVDISSNAEWTITDLPSWITASPSSGSGDASVKLTAEPSENTYERYGTIKVNINGTSTYASKTFKQLAQSLTPGSYSLSFDADGGSSALNIAATGAWSVSSSSSWLSISPASGSGNASIYVTAEKNNTDAERVATIKFAFANSSTSVNVVQGSNFLTVSNPTFSYSSAGGSHAIDIAGTEDWTVATTGNSAWLHCSPTSGHGKSSIAVTIDKNKSPESRADTIIVTPQFSQTVKFPIAQAGQYLNVNTTSVSFFAGGGTSDNIAIDSDGSFEISLSADAAGWLSYSPTQASSVPSASKSSTTKVTGLTLTALPNNGETERTATVTIKLTGLSSGSLQREISVRQIAKGGSFIVNGYESDVDLNASAGKGVSVTINSFASDLNWDASSSGATNISTSDYPTDSDWSN